MKIFIFSIINYIAGFHLLPEFTDVEEINTLKTHWIDKSGRSIPRMAISPTLTLFIYDHLLSNRMK